MEFVYDRREEILDFGSSLYGPHGVPGDREKCKTIGIVDLDGKLIAGFIYFNYDDRAETIEFGVASSTPRWLTPITYRRLFEYPFVECGCQMLMARVRSYNYSSLNVMARMNFNFTMVPRLFGRSEDGVLCTLTDDQWLDCAITKRVYREMRQKMEAA